MKRTVVFFIALSAVALLYVFAGCGGEQPINPGPTPVPIVIGPSCLVDGFEDNDTYNSVTPQTNAWYAYTDAPDGGSSSVSSLGVVSGGYSSLYALCLTATVTADIPYASGGLYTKLVPASLGYVNLETVVHSSGADVTSASYISFACMSVNQADGYRIVLTDTEGRAVYYTFSAGAAYDTVALNLSNFILAPGASGYTVDDVLQSLKTITISVRAYSSTISGTEFYMDNINFYNII